MPRGGGMPRDGGENIPIQQGEAIPTTGGRGGMGAPRGIPTRGSYPPRGMGMMSGMRGRGGPGRGMRGGMDRGRGGMQRGGRPDGFVPRGRPEGGFVPRGRGGGGEMRGRGGGEFVPRGRGGLGGGFQDRSAPRGGSNGFQVKSNKHKFLTQKCTNFYLC
jgi:hypothetical protein